MEDHTLNACVMTPHEVSVDLDDTVSSLVPGEESQYQGFHRVVEWVVCSCGEEFHKGEDGRGSALLKAAQNHARDARAEE